jgi:predicted GTPase
VNDVRHLRDNFSRYVESRIRQEYGLIGTPINLSFKSRKRPPKK